MITNDVVMMSLKKHLQNSDLRDTNQVIYHSKDIDKSYPKNVLFIEFEPLCQKLWHLCKFWHVLPSLITRYGDNM